MGKTTMGAAAVSLDGFIADDNDDVGRSSTGSAAMSAGACRAATARPEAARPRPTS
jgi:hypothetical protein